MGRKQILTSEQVENIRKLRHSGLTHGEIRKITKFSAGTIQKYLRSDPNERESDYSRENLRRAKYNLSEEALDYVSPIDGEKLRIMPGFHGYWRLSATKFNRRLLHAHEAEKVLALLGIKWNRKYVVHHIGLDEKNYNLSNLSIMESVGSHRAYHNKLEKALFRFVENKNLLEQFYAENKFLKLISLDDLIKHFPKRPQQI